MPVGLFLWTQCSADLYHRDDESQADARRTTIRDSTVGPCYRRIP